jgi:hypothetical protein
MKILAIIAIVFLIWIAFDLLWSLATMALFITMIVGVLYIGYKLIWGRW